MSNVKLNFLNWQPDVEDYRNEGLITADNVIHSPEGYIQYKTPTTFVTSTAIGTCPSMVVRSVGTNDQRVVAYLNNATAAGAGYTIDLNLGLFSSNYTTVALYTSMTSSTIGNLSTQNRVVAFDVCELGGVIFMAAQAELPVTTALNAGDAPVVTLNATGYATI
jgi:hypothetical protein